MAKATLRKMLYPSGAIEFCRNRVLACALSVS